MDRSQAQNAPSVAEPRQSILICQTTRGAEKRPRRTHTKHTTKHTFSRMLALSDAGGVFCPAPNMPSTPSALAREPSWPKTPARERSDKSNTLAARVRFVKGKNSTRPVLLSTRPVFCVCEQKQAIFCHFLLPVLSRDRHQTCPQHRRPAGSALH